VEAFNLNEERSSGEGYFEGDMYVFRDGCWVLGMALGTKDGVRGGGGVLLLNTKIGVGQGGACYANSPMGRCKTVDYFNCPLYKWEPHKKE